MYLYISRHVPESPETITLASIFSPTSGELAILVIGLRTACVTHIFAKLCVVDERLISRVFLRILFFPFERVVPDF